MLESAGVGIGKLKVVKDEVTGRAVIQSAADGENSIGKSFRPQQDVANSKQSYMLVPTTTFPLLLPPFPFPRTPIFSFKTKFLSLPHSRTSPQRVNPLPL